MGETIVRAAVRDDIPTIVSLWRVLQETNALHDPYLTPGPDAEAWFREYLKARIDGEIGIFVAVRAGEVVGYTFGQIVQRPTLAAGECGYIADLCVRPDSRGHGIGRRLYERLRLWFIDNDVHNIEVQVVRANPASQAFWRKMGFGEFLKTLRTEISTNQGNA
ncbi:MAG: GNAT family N-acetyltransferase [Capsulimonas sp.]|uniref:GNAT family N-acetyltransferase n=1 Tax=Capsulimonas sp. TaxID=2494211 RepID=UPI0032678A95